MRLTLTRSSASLKLMTFQIAFKYCKVPTNDTHRERPRESEREDGERVEVMRTGGQQVSAGVQKFFPPITSRWLERREGKKKGKGR